MSKLVIAGLAFIVLGVISMAIQSIFFGYMDAEGVIHDSVFLPLSFILGAIGVILLFIKGIIHFLDKLK